jgi:hypothetical protein
VFTPTVAGTATITATSTEDNSKSGTTSIVVGSPTTNDEWAWMSGSSTAGAAGDYGTLGVASASNVPSAREEALSWTDSSGNLWLFGGKGLIIHTRCRAVCSTISGNSTPPRSPGPG